MSKPFAYVDQEGEVFIAGQKMPVMEYCDHMPELIHHINNEVDKIINESVTRTLMMIKENISIYNKNKEVWCGYEDDIINDMVSRLEIAIKTVELLKP